MKPFILTLFLLGTLLLSDCQKSITPVSIEGVDVRFYLSDSVGSVKYSFTQGENIYFHFEIKNNRSDDLHYRVSHGGPSVVNFLIYRSGRLIGTTDDGYSFPAIVVPGSIKAGKTLEYKTSWYSNPYHKDSLLNAGSYTVKIDPYIRFTDFDLKKNLKTITFTVTD